MQLPQFEVHNEIEERNWWFLGRRSIIRDVLRGIHPPSKDILVLDVGCGTGGMTAYLSNDYDCVGVDPSEDGILFAKRKYPQVTFICGNAPKDVQEQFAKADVILLLEVLELVEDDAAFVRSFVEHMKPGAYFISMQPAEPSLWARHDVGFGHKRRYTVETLRRTWQGLPVHECLLAHANARLYWLAKLMRTLSRWKGTSWGPADTDLATPMEPINTLLARIYGGEGPILRRALEHGTRDPYSKGVSLLAVLRKEG